jgi:hypothetical protein
MSTILVLTMGGVGSAVMMGGAGESAPRAVLGRAGGAVVWSPKHLCSGCSDIGDVLGLGDWISDCKSGIIVFSGGGVGDKFTTSVDFDVVVCLDLFGSPVEFGAKELSCAPCFSVGAAGIVEVGGGVVPKSWGVCEQVEIDMLMGVEGCPIHTRCL